MSAFDYILFFIGLRLRYDDYLCEAYGCKPCFVRAEKLNSVDIARIRRDLVKPQRIQPGPKPQSSSQTEVQAKVERRQNDSLFKPPVPCAVQTVDVNTIDRECNDN